MNLDGIKDIDLELDHEALRDGVGHHVDVARVLHGKQKLNHVLRCLDAKDLYGLGAHVAHVNVLLGGGSGYGVNARRLNVGLKGSLNCHVGLDGLDVGLRGLDIGLNVGLDIGLDIGLDNRLDVGLRLHGVKDRS